eukprot:COSAG03_NODE_24006_length_275_cov_0.886364_1_plen_28_part_01
MPQPLTVTFHSCLIVAFRDRTGAQYLVQ